MCQQQAAAQDSVLPTNPSVVQASDSSPIAISGDSGSSSSSSSGASSNSIATSTPLGEIDRLDRRSSSIATLRLKAREHELRLEMIRKNGTDLLS